jgi:hypothetical protein
MEYSRSCAVSWSGCRVVISRRESAMRAPLSRRSRAILVEPWKFYERKVAL